MSQEEVILKQEAGVKQYDSESPPSMGLRAGAFAEVGTIILTNRRLIYVSKGGASRAAAWALGGALAARAMEKSLSQAEMDDFMKYEGSYFVPLQEITHVEAGRKIGNAFLRVISRSQGQKPAHSYVFGSGFSNNNDWENAINSAISDNRQIQSNSQEPSIITQNQVLDSMRKPCQRCGTVLDYDSKFCSSCGLAIVQSQSQIGWTSPPPPLPPSQEPTCPNCHGQIRYIQQYQRWYCDLEKKYL